MDVVIPAAGRGTRLRPLTAEQPKPLVTVGDRALIDHVLTAVAPTDPQRVIIVLGHRGEQLRHRLGTTYAGLPVEYVTQPAPRGLADALLQAAPRVEDTVLVVNADNVYTDSLDYLTRAHETIGTVLVETVGAARARSTGVVTTDEKGCIEAMVEKPASPPSQTVSAGAAVFEPAIFAACREIDRAETGEYELANAITHLATTDCVRTVSLRGDRVNVNTPADVEAAAALRE